MALAVTRSQESAARVCAGTDPSAPLVRGQIQRILEKLGAENIWCEYAGNGVEARAWRPQ